MKITTLQRCNDTKELQQFEKRDVPGNRCDAYLLEKSRKMRKRTE